MIRFLLLLALLGISLLAIFPAPTYHLWLLAITVTEYPLVYIALVSLVLLSGLWSARSTLPSNLVGGIAMVLFISPVVQAALMADKVAQELKQAFGGELVKPSPFSFFKMIGGSSKKEVLPVNYTYHNSPEAQLKLNFYPAQSKGLRPCVVVIHGGSWRSGDNEQLAGLNSRLAWEGYHVAAINYRLAPQFAFPAQMDDVRNALHYLKRNAASLRIDTNRLVLAGRSAGAQMALLAAYTFKQPSIKGVIDFYGPADMVWGYQNPASPLVMNSCKVLEDYLGGSYLDLPQRYQASSAINFVNSASVPTLMVHGKNDVLVSYLHSTRLQEKLKKYKVPHYLLSIPWATHGFDYSEHGPGAQLSTYAVLSFLKRVCR